MGSLDLRSSKKRPKCLSSSSFGSVNRSSPEKFRERRGLLDFLWDYSKSPYRSTKDPWNQEEELILNPGRLIANLETIHFPAHWLL